MKITYYGHSCFATELGGKKLLFDPFIRPNALAANVNVEEIMPDIILVTHGHWDHVADLVEIATRSQALVIANFEIVDWLGKQGVTNCHPMNIGGGYDFGWAYIKMTNAIHSSTLPDGSPAGNPGGFLVDSEEFTFFYSGDTALTLDFELIGEAFDIDLAILPIGDNFTMGMEDAIVCADLLQCNKIMGVHYDTFPVIKIDKEEAMNMFQEEELELVLMEIGEEVEIEL